MSKTLTAHREHPRRFEDFKFVYPVLSRRSRGISIGLNTNPDKACNFDCVYCQVDRTKPAETRWFDVEGAEAELRALLDIVKARELAKFPPFDAVPERLLRLNDVALSGDGEPTTLKNFSGVVEMVTRCTPRHVKIILITDASGLDREDVKRGLELMDAHHGEVWAKLDAGTEEHFKAVNRTSVPFRRILNNLTETARNRPIAIQSLFLRLFGRGPGAEEIAAYCDRLTAIMAAGGQIKFVQVCTMARQSMAQVNSTPAGPFVGALTDAEVDAIADCVRLRTGLPTESFYGA